MTPEIFAAGLMESVVEDNLATDRGLFANTMPDDASDPYWKRSLALYHSLSAEHQTVLFEIIRQTAVDTHRYGSIRLAWEVEGGCQPLDQQEEAR